MDHKILLEIPERIDAGRIYLRCYKPGDEEWLYEMSQQNREHLARYEAENVVMNIKKKQDAVTVVRNLVDQWKARKAFFMGVFRKDTDEFVAQIYIGPVNWDLPEFEIGFFADRDHEGMGYVTEAAGAALRFIFRYLHAHRVRMECDDTNERSQRVAEQSGMIKEGHIRENKKNVDGTISGTLYFGLLRSEFGGIPGKVVTSGRRYYS
ncbi:MAG: GNAT family N-acetyltransferase [Spirochaetales bacterium]|nr:GNAT family N-acetyltransferase [Spirochaetales bacterium]